MIVEFAQYDNRKTSSAAANSCLTVASLAHSAMTIFVSIRYLPLIQVYLLASLVNRLLQCDEIARFKDAGKREQFTTWNAARWGRQSTHKRQHFTLLWERERMQVNKDFLFERRQSHSLYPSRH